MFPASMIPRSSFAETLGSTPKMAAYTMPPFLSAAKQNLCPPPKTLGSQMGSALNKGSAIPLKAGVYELMQK